MQISKHFDEDIPEGARWHQDLLERMTSQVGERPPVFSPETREELINLLSFRHFIRMGYAIDVQWELMKGLVADFEKVYGITIKEIEEFISEKKIENRD